MAAESLIFRFESSALSGTVLSADRAVLTEALNEPYVLDLELRAEQAADLTEMLGKDAVLTIDRTSIARRVCGLVVEVTQHEPGPDNPPAARVRVVPGLWALSLRRNTRMFQNLGVDEILKDVLEAGLGPYGQSVEPKLNRSYPKREYCLQYQESDLDFVSRLMEEEGITYAFDHEGEVEVLHLRDRNSDGPPVTSLKDVLDYSPQNLYVREFEPILAFHPLGQHTATALAIRDWDWTRGGDMKLETTADGQDPAGRTRESYEHGLGASLTIGDYSEPRYGAEDGAAQKDVRLQGHTMGVRVVEGISRVVGFAPGVTFELAGHPTVGVDGEYFVTRVIHENRRAPMAGGAEPAGDAEEYHNRFECIPKATEHRPARRTPKARIPSIQTAIVTGPSGEEIHTDVHGRIKVQFGWDRENPADETSSCWVRCEQAWSGSAWGFWWLPRIGMEVVVQFVDGDPDRPVVTGCVYNGTNATPYTLPDEKTKSTIKSNTSPGGGGSNELRFEDKAGSEEIYAHAQKDYNEVVENDHNTTVHANQDNTVDGDQTQTIHTNQTEKVDGDQKMTVDANRTIHVKSAFDETIDGTEKRHTTGAVSETFGASETKTIAASVTETIGGAETRSISASQTETIGAAHSQTIGGASTTTIGGALDITAGGGISTTTPSAYSYIALSGIKVNAAAGTKWVASGGIKLIAPAGTRFIDGENDWFGGLVVDAAPSGTACFGLKVELGASAFELFGAKVNTHVFHLCLGAVQEQGDGVESVGKTINAQTGVRLNILAVKVAG